ncbi:hypothetical protein LEADMM068B1_16080 [Leclercia adecarboxylata]
MVRKNRIVVDYSLSVLERTKASKLINDHKKEYLKPGNDSNLLIVFYVQIMPDDLVMQLHRF